jgi:hypothetical protein
MFAIIQETIKKKKKKRCTYYCLCLRSVQSCIQQAASYAWFCFVDRNWWNKTLKAIKAANRTYHTDHVVHRQSLSRQLTNEKRENVFLSL